MPLNYCHHIFEGNYNEKGDQLFPIYTEFRSGGEGLNQKLKNLAGFRKG